MITSILANTGYFIGIGVEAFVILICALLLALMLTGLLFKWLAQSKETKLVKAEAKAAYSEAWSVIEEERAAQLAAEEEAERAQAEIDARAKAEAEAAAAEAAAVAEAKRAEEEAKNKPKLQPAPAKVAETTTEEEVVTERVVERVVVQEPAAVAEAAVAEAEAEEEVTEDGDREFVVVHDGIVFNDSKTITELYEELSPEQQSYFDELREEALTKPDAELAISKNFVSVKIGKRNLIKLLIKRGVTVAEFMLENEALKQLRLSNTNKRGKSAIKIKPTIVQVLDLASLKVAVDMINLSYEEIMMD